MPPTESRAGSNTRRRHAHRNWFVLILAVLTAAGVAVATVAMLPLGMATDPCHEGSPDRICQLSASGQNFLMLVPWLAALAGLVVTVAAAAVAMRRGHSPLLVLPIGVVGYLAAIYLGWHCAFTL